MGERLKHITDVVCRMLRGEGTAEERVRWSREVEEARCGEVVKRLEDEGYELFRPKKTNILATEQNGELIPLYALVKSVRQSPEPWWPDDTLVLELGRREIERIIK